MAASKQANKHTHARAQCSHASVGLAQACPNDIHRYLLCIKWKVFCYVYTNSIVSPTWIYQLSEHPLVPACSDK